MSDTDHPFDWQAVRQTGTTLVLLSLAYALTLLFGYASYLGFSQSALSSAEIVAQSAEFMAGAVYQWSLRGVIALLALAQGFALARRLKNEQALLHALPMAGLSLSMTVVFRFGLGLLFPAPVGTVQLVVDAAVYGVSLALALSGALVGVLVYGETREEQETGEEHEVTMGEQEEETPTEVEPAFNAIETEEELSEEAEMDSSPEENPE